MRILSTGWVRRTCSNADVSTEEKKKRSGIRTPCANRNTEFLWPYYRLDCLDNSWRDADRESIVFEDMGYSAADNRVAFRTWTVTCALHIEHGLFNTIKIIFDRMRKHFWTLKFQRGPPTTPRNHQFLLFFWYAPLVSRTRSNDNSHCDGRWRTSRRRLYRWYYIRARW